MENHLPSWPQDNIEMAMVPKSIPHSVQSPSESQPHIKNMSLVGAKIHMKMQGAETA